ncbi:hypothetical protein [Arthrobacter sp. Leaf69]|uniref:hypothetical protein n=1 Tax=Arthrobacter sp. Leaf69 TaxID=1736232 RepID=UPI0012E23243|nr:hypothetical protein [Arthrobacter sp. Leaf69]
MKEQRNAAWAEAAKSDARADREARNRPPTEECAFGLRPDLLDRGVPEYKVRPWPALKNPRQNRRPHGGFHASHVAADIAGVGRSVRRLGRRRRRRLPRWHLHNNSSSRDGHNGIDYGRGLVRAGKTGAATLHLGMLPLKGINLNNQARGRIDPTPWHYGNLNPDYAGSAAVAPQGTTTAPQEIPHGTHRRTAAGHLRSRQVPRRAGLGGPEQLL